MMDQPSQGSFRTASGRAGPFGEPLAVLPSGRVLDLRRPRSDGPLDGEALDWCRATGVPLAYDPAQVGWLPAGAADDLAPPRRGWEGRLRLRAWREEDLEAYLGLLDDPRVWAHLPDPYPDPLTPALARDLIAISNVGGHHEVLAVEADGTVAGQVRLAFATDGGEAEVSYWLGSAHWGRGIGSALVALFTDRSFRRRPGLGAIVARVHRGNPASARVLKKAGYREAGQMADDPAWRLFRRERPRP